MQQNHDPHKRFPTGARRRPTIITAAGLGVITLLGACGDDAHRLGNDVASAESVVEVVMSDFRYGNLPAEVPAGTRIQVANDSENELHEFVAFRLDDAEERTIEEIVTGDLGAMLGGAEPATVLLAAPGGDQIPAVGDGTLAVPGRYLVLCVVPTGADPGEYLEAAATSDGPPQVEGGPPHVMNGMFAELRVTGN